MILKLMSQWSFSDILLVTLICNQPWIPPEFAPLYISNVTLSTFVTAYLSYALSELLHVPSVQILHHTFPLPNTDV